jgi:hypothetical protein
VARFLAEKYFLRLVVVANIFIGLSFNRYVTKAVGKWAKVKAKTRSSLFQRIDGVNEKLGDSAPVVLPLVFWVGTADDRLTDNVLMLYAQTVKRFDLTEKEAEEIRRIVDRDDLYEALGSRLRAVGDPEARRLLFEIAVTTAAVDLEDKDDYHECLVDLGKVLEVDYSREDFRRMIKYLTT